MVMIAHTLTYGNVSSSEHGVYISGEGVYNAPERVVELVNVPGRNGALTIDQGHFDNITIEYPCFTFATSQEEFRRIVNSFKNAMIAQGGYQKLSDDYNPDEYRMALFVEGIEFEPVQYGRAGSFTLSFNCKPQRYLVDGDNEVTITNGSTLNNPTLYDAEPLLMVEGYGNIGLNGYSISIENDVLGSAYPMNNTTNTYWSRTGILEQHSVTLNDVFNNGDIMNFNAKIKFELGTDSTITKSGYTKKYQLYSRDATFSNSSGIAVTSMSQSVINTNGVQFILNYDNFSFTKGTASTLRSVASYKGEATVETYGGRSGSGSQGIEWWEINYQPYDVEVTINFAYDGDSTITIYASYNLLYGQPSGEDSDLVEANPPVINVSYIEQSISDLVSQSTVSMLGHPTYIDCEIGEAYMYKNGQLISLNAHIDLGSDLPKLASGINTFTLSNTITSLLVVPKWWQL